MLYKQVYPLQIGYNSQLVRGIFGGGEENRTPNETFYQTNTHGISHFQAVLSQFSIWINIKNIKIAQNILTSHIQNVNIHITI